jgi:hypothetical protein
LRTRRHAIEPPRKQRRRRGGHNSNHVNRQPPSRRLELETRDERKHHENGRDNGERNAPNQI